MHTYKIILHGSANATYTGTPTELMERYYPNVGNTSYDILEFACNLTKQELFERLNNLKYKRYERL